MDERSDRVAKRLERPLLVAAVLTIPVTILQLLPADDPWLGIADVLNWMIWLTFLAEAAIMLAVVPSRTRWLRGQPPRSCDHSPDAAFYHRGGAGDQSASGTAAPPVAAARPPGQSTLQCRGASLCGTAHPPHCARWRRTFASVENISLGNGIYWAITTMTTVGYGDITPKTPEGKVIAITVMAVGIGFATLLIGAISERFIKREVTEVLLDDDDLLKQVRDISARLQRLEQALQRRETHQ